MFITVLLLLYTMTILTAIDGGPNSDRVVEAGYDLAKAYGDELVVSHVMPKDEFKSRHQTVPDYYRSNAVDEAEQIAAGLVEDTLDTTDGVRADGWVGEPSEVILRQADQLDARYIVVGGRRRSPTGKAIFGSDTQQILLNSPRKVVVVMGLMEE